MEDFKERDEEKEEEKPEEEEEVVEEDKNQSPLIVLARWKFFLTVDDSIYTPDQKTTVKNAILDAVRENKMWAWYRHVCKSLGWSEDIDSASMQLSAQREVVELEAKIEEAKVNEGDTEVRDAKLTKANFVAHTGEKETAMAAYKDVFEATIGSGERIDVVFKMIHVAMLWEDWTLVRDKLEQAQGLVEKEGDWERRNLLAVYRALYLLTKRDLGGASALLLQSIATFTCYQLLEYNSFVFLALLSSLVSLDRVSLKKKVIECPEILSVVREIPNARELMMALYSCDYLNFFRALGLITPQIKADPYLAPHTAYYLRQLRIVAYTQFLESYSSVKLSSMAAAFGVSVPFLDTELSRFISSGRLNCKIDKVAGIVETNRPDAKNTQYQATLKQGDILLNRVQKLSKIVHL